MAEDDHDFGGPWTIIKLDVLEKYLSFFTTALKNQKFNLIYIDAFAGTGKCTVTNNGEKEIITGSALRALHTSPSFDELIFVEQHQRRFSALEELKNHHLDRKITLHKGDANHLIAGIIDQHNWVKSRGVLFLDPYGMNADWSVLEKIAATKALDMWYLFSLSGLYRQAARDKRKIDDAKRAAITRQLGTSEWEEALYSESPQSDMFGADPATERHADVRGLAAYVKKRLNSIFPAVSDGLILPTTGIPKFALYFAASNPQPNAYGLAMKGANHILKSASRG